jgi:hypothetical protein
MKNTYWFLVVLFFLVISSIEAFSQTDSAALVLSQSRNKNISHMLDYRYKGGSGAFEGELLKHVSYTQEALANCVVGTVILSFTVGCDNKISDLRMRNPLHYGLNEKIQEFFNATEGQWNSCNDERYTRFEVPILFTIKNTETNATGFVIVEGEGKGLRCKSDAYYLEQFKKWSKKGKIKRALSALDVLIQRDPYNQNNYDLKKSFLSKQDSN